MSCVEVVEENIDEVPSRRGLRAAKRDRRAERNELVEANLGCVDHFVRKYSGRGVPRDDLRQTAFVALVQAAERFDPSVGAAFTTFASRTIDGTIKRYFRDRTWSVRPPRATQELHLRLRAADEALHHRFGRRPTVAELAQEVGTDIDHVLEALDAGGALRAASLDQPAGDDEGLNPYDRLGGDDPSYATVEAGESIERALAVLDERSRKAVYLRFFEHLSQEEIADRLGISQSYLSRVLRAALQEMRAELQPA